MVSQEQQVAIQAASDNIAVAYTLIAALALLTYDTSLTMRHEIDDIWNRKLKLGTVLYFLARYCALLELLVVILMDFLNTSLQTCNGILHFVDSLNLLPLISVQGHLFARTYAITEHRRPVLVVLGVLGAFAIILNMASSIIDRCDTTSAQLHSLVILSDVGTILVILFDTVVVAVTLASTLGTWRIYKRSTWHMLTLTHLLAQQGLMRYGFVLTITLADVIVPLALRPTLRGALAYIQNSLSAIIICRFHLDLQRSHAHPQYNTSGGLPTISLGSFHAATQSLHDAVIAEFGDLDADERIGADSSREEAMRIDVDVPAGTPENDIALEEIQSRPEEVEFPWGRSVGPSMT